MPEKTLLQKIEFVRDHKDLTTYTIAKETGLPYSAVYRFRSGGSLLENITLRAAMKYEILYDRLAAGDKSLLSTNDKDIQN